MKDAVSYLIVVGTAVLGMAAVICDNDKAEWLVCVGALVSVIYLVGTSNER